MARRTAVWIRMFVVSLARRNGTRLPIPLRCRSKNATLPPKRHMLASDAGEDVNPIEETTANRVDSSGRIHCRNRTATPGLVQGVDASAQAVNVIDREEIHQRAFTPEGKPFVNRAWYRRVG